MQLINVLQCFAALFPVIKKLLLIAFQLISIISFSSDNLNNKPKSSGIRIKMDKQVEDGLAANL
jgi:hypothetical protein